MEIEKLLDDLGYRFRSLSYHSDGRWIAQAGKQSGGFIVSARTPAAALEKLFNKDKRMSKELPKIIDESSISNLETYKNNQAEIIRKAKIELCHELRTMNAKGDIELWRAIQIKLEELGGDDE